MDIGIMNESLMRARTKPMRLVILIKTAVVSVGALKLSNLKSVILDWTWRDAKQRRLMDIPEVYRAN
jgi:hypothetical protein